MSRPDRYYSVDEYLEMESTSEIRHEYLHGSIVAMSGGTADHNTIALNLRDQLHELRARGCRTFVADLRVMTPSGLYTYPDTVTVCGTTITLPSKGTTVTNPTVIAEVLSRDTALYDRGKKFELYQTLATLRDYLLIDQYRVDVEHRWREGNLWQSKHYTSGESFALTGVPLTIAVDALYEDVTIPA
jgi:Uma2 family endonuclease